MQPLLLRGATTGHASATEMAQAGYALFQRCVVDKGIGGIAADIGAFSVSFLLIYLLVILMYRSMSYHFTWELRREYFNSGLD